MSFQHECYGIPKSFYSNVDQLVLPSKGSFVELDQQILELGPHEVAHFMTLTDNPEAAEKLELYLKDYWPAYLVLIERLVHAAKRDENEDVLSDLGQS
jgi:hypothetical protein